MNREQNFSAEEQNLRLMSGAHRYHRWLQEQFEPHLCGQKILEVGAGVGNLTQYILPLGYRITCTDVNKSNLEELQRRCPSVRVLLDDIAQTSLDEKFDTIICVNVLEHIEDDLSALRNMNRLLSKTGRLLLLVPAMPSVYGTVDEADGHYRRYSRNDLKVKIQEAGFNTINIRYMNLAGLIGWWWDGRVRKRRVHRAEALGWFDRLVPVFKIVEQIVSVPIGLSLVVVAQPTVSLPSHACKKL